MYHRFVVLNPFDSGNGQPAFQAFLWHFPVFLTCNVRKEIGLLCTFSSGRVTSGNCKPAFQAHLWHFPVFLTCNVRMKIGILCTFSSGRVTSGTAQRAYLCSQGSCSKSFWDSPPPDSPPGHINPKTILNNAIPAPLWPFRVVCVTLFTLFSPPGFPDV